MSSPFPSRVVNELTASLPLQFFRRGLAIHSPRFNLITLGHLDERLDAMLAAFVECSETEFETYAPRIKAKPVGGLAVLTFMAAWYNHAAGISALAEEAATTGGVKRAEFLAALHWLDFERVQHFASSLFGSASPAMSELGLTLHALHHVTPARGLRKALQHTHPGLRATAARVIGELGLVARLDPISELLHDADESVAFHSAATFARLKPSPDSTAVLCGMAEKLTPFAQEAAFLAGTVMPSAEWLRWMDKLAASSEAHTALAIRSAIGQGDIRMVPWFIGTMYSPKLAHASAEGFSALTGLDLVKFNYSSGSNDADGLPAPDIPRICQWWDHNQDRFPTEGHWFLGQTVSLQGLHSALVSGNMRQRAWAAQLLGRLRPDKPAFPISAPVLRQKAMLGLR